MNNFEKDTKELLEKCEKIKKFLEKDLEKIKKFSIKTPIYSDVKKLKKIYESEKEINGIAQFKVYQELSFNFCKKHDYTYFISTFFYIREPEEFNFEDEFEGEKPYHSSPLDYSSICIECLKDQNIVILKT